MSKPQLDVQPYDPITDSITIEGTKYAAIMFREMGCNLHFKNMIGQVLRIDKKEDGVVTVTRLQDREGE